MEVKDYPLFVHPNLYKGLKDYMAEIGDEYLDIRKCVPTKGSGSFLACRACGSTGPLEINSSIFEDKKGLYKDVLKDFNEIISVTYLIFFNPDGSIRFQPTGRKSIDLVQLNEELLEKHDIWLREALRCPRCGYGDVDIYDEDGRVDAESLELYGDEHFFCDNPTEMETEGEGFDQKIISEEITREGVIQRCLDCYGWETDGKSPSMFECALNEMDEGLEDEEVSIYHTGDEWLDLCKGPHIENASKIKAFKLLSVAGAYWRGDERKAQLQRIYGTAFFEGLCI